MMRHTKRTLVFIVAVLFILLGVVGLVLPFIQGLLFLAVGLVILSVLFPALRERAQIHTVKFPKFHAFVLKMETIVQRILGDV